jgi:hypothetical protein
MAPHSGAMRTLTEMLVIPIRTTLAPFEPPHSPDRTVAPDEQIGQPISISPKGSSAHRAARLLTRLGVVVTRRPRHKLHQLILQHLTRGLDSLQPVRALEGDNHQLAQQGGYTVVVEAPVQGALGVITGRKEVTGWRQVNLRGLLL